MDVKDKIKFGDCLKWHNVLGGFTCYKCGQRYEGHQTGLAWNGKMACKRCAQEQGFFIDSKVKI